MMVDAVNSCCCCCPSVIDEDSVDVNDEILKDLNFVLGEEMNTPSTRRSLKICTVCLNKVNEFATFKRQVLDRQKQLANDHDEDSKLAHTPVLEDYQSVIASEDLTIEKLNVSFNCNNCQHQFTTRRNLTRHLQQVHDIHRCIDCNLSFKTRWQYLKHSRIVHRKSIAETKDLKICPHCGKALKGNNHLNFHIKTKHLKLTKFSCDLCSFKCYGKYEIRSHIEIHHLPLETRKDFPCDQCTSVLTTAMSLKTHKMHKHSSLKSHECFCGKSFSLKETLKSHIKNVHQGERRFKCDQCDKGFSSNVRLKDHINNYHGTRQQFECDKCNKTFNSLRNLKTHSIYHKPPTFPCQHCDKKFFLKKNLVEHEESVHLEIKHDCEVCKRTFKSTSALRRHMKNCKV